MEEMTVHDLVRFHRSFVQLSQPDLLPWPSSEDLAKSEVQTLLANAVASHAVPTGYDSEVARHLWQRLEPIITAMTAEDDAEINDDLLDWIARARQTAGDDATSEDYHRVVYVPPWVPPQSDLRGAEETAIRVFERRRVFAAHGSTAHSTWNAALHCATLIQIPAVAQFIDGKTILELGAGTGFLSLVCARHGKAKRVVASDIDHAALARLRESCQPGDAVSVEHLAWADPDTDISRWEQVETVLATDVTYEIDTISDLVDFLGLLFESRRVSRLHHSKVPPLIGLVVSTVRKPQALEHFESGCAERKLSVTQLELPVQVVHDLCAENRQMGFFHRFGNGADYRVYVISSNP